MSAARALRWNIEALQRREEPCEAGRPWSGLLYDCDDFLP